jgi:hypothetical protein
MADRRWLALILATCLGTGAGWPATEALAVPRGYVLVHAQLQIIVNTLATELCIGDQTRFAAILMTTLEYRNSAGQTITTARPTGRAEQIRATSGSPSIATVAPQVARQTGLLRGSAQFTVTGKQAGRVTITFTDDTRGQASPGSLTLEVKNCHYEVTMSSTWRLTRGFKPTLHSELTKVPLLPTGVFGSYIANPKMANSATAPDDRGCIVTFDVGRSGVAITAFPDLQHAGVLNIGLSFDRTPAPKVEVCHKPHAFAQGTGQGKPRVLNFAIDMSAASTTKTLSHVIDADEVSTGTTTITIEKVPN